MKVKRWVKKKARKTVTGRNDKGTRKGETTKKKEKEGEQEEYGN